MNWKFWKINKKEEPKQRGYFDSVNAPDGNVTTWLESYASGSSPTLAMKIATVYRCVDILSSTIASLPLELKVKRNGVFEVKDTGTLAYLITCQSNERQTSYEVILLYTCSPNKAVAIRGRFNLGSVNILNIQA